MIGANLIDIAQRELCANYSIDETDNFRSLVSVTYTLIGQIPDLIFKEEELFKKLIPTDRIIQCRCSGIIRHDRYKPVERARGQPNARFSNQITFTVRKSATPIEGVINDVPVFKIMIFQTGKFQVAGVGADEFDSVIKCLNLITDMIGSKQCNLLQPIMGWYYYHLKLTGSKLNMAHFSNIISRHGAFSNTRYVLEAPKCIKSKIISLGTTITIYESGNVHITSKYEQIGVVCAILREIVTKNYNVIFKTANDLAPDMARLEI